jgi:hypothetical protein
LLDSSFEVLAVHDLCAEQVLLGGQTRRVKEAQVTIGKPQVFPLVQSSFPFRLATKVDFLRWRYFRVLFPFTLSKPSLGRFYAETRYEVELDESDAIALQLDLVPVAPSASASIAPPTPMMLPGGLGDSHFRWDLVASADGRLYWGTQLPRAVLQVPKSLSLLTGLIMVHAVLADRDAGAIDLDHQDPQPFELSLADGGFRSLAR